MNLLMIYSNFLEKIISRIGYITDKVWHPDLLVGTTLPKFLLKKLFNCFYDFVHRVGVFIGNSIDLSRRLWFLCSQQKTLTNIIHIGHRSSIISISNNWHFAIANHAEK